MSSGDDERHGRAALGGAAVYGVLSLGFGEPGPTLPHSLLGVDLTGALREALNGQEGWEDCATAARALQECAAAAASTDEALADLRAEYTRLFTGPGMPAVACYESEYLEQPRAGGRGRLGGSVAAAVEAAYLSAEVATTAGRREPPDFVAVELEFLYTLNVREAEASAAGDAAEARRLHSVAERFLSAHAQRWLPSFAAALQSESRDPLYTALGALLGCFLTAQRRFGEQAGVVGGRPAPRADGAGG